MYSLFREVHPPTGVELAVVCNFMNRFEEDLIVCTANELHIYKLNHNVGRLQDATSRKENFVSEKSSKAKLECQARFKLFGKVVSVESIKTENHPDSLLLSFEEAKCVVVQYDHECHDLKSYSMHSYENDELRDGKRQNRCNQPVVRCDHNSRCAAMLVYGNKLAIVPFSKDESGLKTLQSYVIDLRKLNEKVTNLIDFQFLHGYSEPTLAILYEPLPTWAGRIASKKDSCSLIAISLNTEEKTNPTIWSLSNLPFDALRLLPVPKPLGGVIVFAVNSLLYFSQSSPPHGVSLNSIGSATTDFLLKVQDDVQITLDCAQACFLKNDKVLISLKEGDLYVLTLLHDNTKSIRGFSFEKAATCVLTTCMCVIEDEYLFLGSRLGNTLLLRYCEKSLDDKTASDYPELSDSPMKDLTKEAIDNEDWLELDDLEVYNKDDVQHHLVSYTFEMCDSMINIGPCQNAIMGCAASLSEEFVDSENPDVELVTTSGFNKSGAISVLQKSIRPQLVTTFKLLDCIDMWTVVSKDETAADETYDDDGESEENYNHSLMILSELKSTMILRAGIEISELDQSGFITQAPTIFAGNIGSNQYIVQVSTCGVRLLEGTRNLQHVALSDDSAVVSCSLVDPYLVLLTSSKQVILMSLKPLSDGNSSRLVVSKPAALRSSNVIALSIYKDDSGLFATRMLSSPPSQKTTKSSEDVNMVDEDELLYGGRFDKAPEKPVFTNCRSLQGSAFRAPTYWLVTCNDDGALYIYSVPDFELKFKSCNFNHVDRVVVNNLAEEPEEASSSTMPNITAPTIREILMVGMGNRNTRPHLMVIMNQELIIYEAFQYHANSPNSVLQIRFKKVVHSLSARDIIYDTNDMIDDETFEKNVLRSKRKFLRQFDNVSGLTGVFLCGSRPHWIFMTYRGMLRCHPMLIDGPITFLASFHNVNCPNGFIYFNLQCELRISMLPSNLLYDAPWPVRKIPLRCTPYYVAYNVESKLYAVAMSMSKPCNKLVKIVGDNEKEIEPIERGPRFVYPHIERFSVQLYSSLNWEPIPHCRYEFDEFERVSCMQTINLKSEGTVSGLKGYIVCGTTYTYTEDIPCKGRIVIFDVIEVVPEPGAPLSKNKLKVEYDREQKGGVSAIAGVQGLLVTAMGQKIYIWQLKDGDLKGVAFIDAQIYTHSIAVVKSLLFVGDVLKSVSLYRYQEEMKVLSIVSRDMQPREIYSLGFLVDNDELYFLASDSDKNVLVYSYMPRIRESHGGQRLIQLASFNVGSHVNSMLRIKCSASDISMDSAKRHATYLCTLDGSIGCVFPLSEKMYKRLLMLQTVMARYVPHRACLNPREYRSDHNSHRQFSSLQKSILDEVLIFSFLELDFMEKKEISSKIGTSLEQVLNDLTEIDHSCSHF